MRFLELCSLVCVNLLCFCLCLFDKIIELHVMDEIFFSEEANLKRISFVMKCLLDL